ncbi:hypothetical protein [Hydrogenophaga sp.]|uniref:hypothetical protein n=1 Tax=Hydrogenophaga sp. TaxID=1904254 RepID=UPI003566B360
MNPPPYGSFDEEYVLPSVEALLAGTLALMTGCAQASGPATHRALMAGKVVSNLSDLSEHPDLSPPMRRMLGNLCGRWQQEVRACDPCAAAARAMPPSRTLQ